MFDQTGQHVETQVNIRPSGTSDRAAIIGDYAEELLATLRTLDGKTEYSASYQDSPATYPTVDDWRNARRLLRTVYGQLAKLDGRDADSMTPQELRKYL